jgi:hypothetical protein
MMRVSSTAARLLGVCALGAAVACSGTPSQGAPVLVAVYWTAPGARYKVWSPPDSPDPAVVARAPGLASQIDFVFDRRLDGERIEDTVVANGVSVQQSMDPPPITATWSPLSPATTPAAPAAGIALNVLYNSIPVYGGSTSYVLAQPRVTGFPSAATMSFALDRSKLTSQTGERLAAPDGVEVVTEDFTATIRAPAAPDGGTAATVGVDYALPISFNNSPGPLAQVLPFVHARASGADLPIALLGEGQDATRLTVIPAACPGAWPPQSLVEVTVDPGLPDAFGVPLGTGANAAFMTGPGAPPAATGCAADGPSR